MASQGIYSILLVSTHGTSNNALRWPPVKPTSCVSLGYYGAKGWRILCFPRALELSEHLAVPDQVLLGEESPSSQRCHWTGDAGGWRT